MHTCSQRCHRYVRQGDGKLDQTYACPESWKMPPKSVKDLREWVINEAYRRHGTPPVRLVKAKTNVDHDRENRRQVLASYKTYIPAPCPKGARCPKCSTEIGDTTEAKYWGWSYICCPECSRVYDRPFPNITAYGRRNRAPAGERKRV